jgi:hypothetical protein
MLRLKYTRMHGRCVWLTKANQRKIARVIQNLLKFYGGLLALAQDVRVYHELSDDDAQVLIHREPHRFQQVGITPILMQAF